MPCDCRMCRRTVADLKRAARVACNAAADAHVELVDGDDPPRLEGAYVLVGVDWIEPCVAPARSPDPCCPDCPGWDVFEVNRCTVHGDACDCSRDDCSQLEIEACIECWFDQRDAMRDDHYAAHPVCLAKLALERALERGEPV